MSKDIYQDYPWDLRAVVDTTEAVAGYLTKNIWHYNGTGWRDQVQNGAIKGIFETTGTLILEGYGVDMIIVPPSPLTLPIFKNGEVVVYAERIPRISFDLDPRRVMKVGDFNTLITLLTFHAYQVSGPFFLDVQIKPLSLEFPANHYRRAGVWTNLRTEEASRAP